MSLRTFDNLTLSNIKKLNKVSLGDKILVWLTFLLWASFIFVIAFLPLWWVGKVFILTMYITLGGICLDDAIGRAYKECKE